MLTAASLQLAGSTSNFTVRVATAGICGSDRELWHGLVLLAAVGFDVYNKRKVGS